MPNNAKDLKSAYTLRMPKNLSEIVADFKQTIYNSNPEVLTREELQDTIAKAHDLLGYAHAQEAKTTAEELQNYIRLSNYLLEQIDQVAKAVEPIKDQKLSTPTQIIVALLQMYTDNVVPMLNRLSNITKDMRTLQQISEITVLGSEILDCCTQIVRYSDKLDTTERIYAFLGVVLLQTGVGLLISLTINPVMNVPPISALSIIAMGSFLCRKSVANHKNTPESSPINTSIKRQDDLMAELSKKLDANNYKRDAKIFSDSPEADAVKPKAKPKRPKVAPAPKPIEEDEAEVKPTDQLGMLEKLKSSFANLFSKGDDKH